METSERFVDFLVAILKSIPRDIPDALAEKWAGRDEELARGLRALLMEHNAENSATPSPPPKPHKDIRILFSVEERDYEAVGFLEEGEKSIAGDIMLARTAEENGGAIGEEDRQFICERRNKLPQELRKYYLATNRRHRVFPRRVSCFRWDSVRWDERWPSLGDQWDAGDLVVRRRT